MASVTAKLTCPGCNAHTSTVWQDYVNGDPCRSCGLPHHVAETIVGIQRSKADGEVKKTAEEAVARAGKLEAEVRLLRGRIQAIRDVLNGDYDENYRYMED